MDNFKINITGYEDNPLRLAMKLALHGALATSFIYIPVEESVKYTGDQSPDTQTKHAVRYDYNEKTGIPSMILYWNLSATEQEEKMLKETMQQFPSAMTAEDLLLVVRQWLDTVNYPSQEQSDGKTVKGWRVFNERLGGLTESVLGNMIIQPYWAKIK